MQTINLIGKKVVRAEGGKQNLYVEGVTGIGRVIIPKGLGLSKGDTLTGEGDFEQVTYTHDENGKEIVNAAGVAEPIVRWEMKSFLSLKDRQDYNDQMNAINLSDAISKAKIAAVPKLAWTTADFGVALGKAVTADEVTV